jgi:hypothetical protein
VNSVERLVTLRRDVAPCGVAGESSNDRADSAKATAESTTNRRQSGELAFRLAISWVLERYNGPPTQTVG